jgi:predicted transcriptional regulator
MLKKGKRQREIAKILNLTEAAVSHYVARRRADGKDRKLNEIVGRQIKKYDSKLTFEENVCNICRGLRRSKDMCIIHMKVLTSKPEKATCDFCASACA